MPHKATELKDTLFECRDLSVKLGNYSALEHIDFCVHKGEIIAVIGPNGSGKSTLLKTILGIYKPNKGSLHLYTKRIGYVPQKLDFDRTIPLTVEELLQLYSGKSAHEILPFLAEVNMEQECKKQVGQLSGGQLQRVLIANALARDPELLLLDEATAGVDVKGEEGFYTLVHRINQTRQIGIIIVSHDIHMVTVYATTIHCLNRTFVCHGHINDIKHNEAYQNLFGIEVKEFHHQHNHD